MMAAPGMRSGVCIVRFEPEPDRWLISVTTIWPLAPDGYAAAPGTTAHFADPDAAIEALAGEIRRMIRDSAIRDVDLSIRTRPRGSIQTGRSDTDAIDRRTT